MKLNMSLVFAPSINGVAVDANTQGWLNVYKTPNGVMSGRKIYPTKEAATQGGSAPEGWKLLGVVQVSEYLRSLPAQVCAAAKTAAAKACDDILLAMVKPKPKPKAKAKPKAKKK